MPVEYLELFYTLKTFDCIARGDRLSPLFCFSFLGLFTPRSYVSLEISSPPHHSAVCQALKQFEIVSHSKTLAFRWWQAVQQV